MHQMICTHSDIIIVLLTHTSTVIAIMLVNRPVAERSRIRHCALFAYSQHHSRIVIAIRRSRTRIVLLEVQREIMREDIYHLPFVHRMTSTFQEVKAQRRSNQQIHRRFDRQSGDQNPGHLELMHFNGQCSHRHIGQEPKNCQNPADNGDVRLIKTLGNPSCEKSLDRRSSVPVRQEGVDLLTCAIAPIAPLKKKAARRLSGIFNVICPY